MGLLVTGKVAPGCHCEYSTPGNPLVSPALPSQPASQLTPQTVTLPAGTAGIGASAWASLRRASWAAASSWRRRVASELGWKRRTHWPTWMPEEEATCRQRQGRS